MVSIQISLPDGSKKSYEAGVTPQQVAQDIGERLARAAIVARANGNLVDTTTPLTEDTTLEILTFNEAEGKEVFWHSSAHVLAQAILRLYPDAKPTIGPPLGDGGFYYDFANLDIKEEDLERIEQEMKKVAKENHATKRIEFGSKQEAVKEFAGNTYKQEIIQDAEGGLSAYEQGEFFDLCRGPHIPRTGMVKAVWLHKLAGAYWRGDAANEQLTRIYGITFPDKKLLKEHKAQVEEAKKRDHRVLGKKLDLFGFEPVAAGSPFFYPRGTIIYNTLLTFLRDEYRKRGYSEVITPLLYHKDLWEQSGHWEHYRDDMFVLENGNEIISLKPMNCPSHCLIFNRTQHSYREMPVRIADFAALHRNELSGTLSGLTRVRKFSQDDAHIFCRPDQIKEEIADLIDFATYLYVSVFHMEFDHVELSTRPEKFLGDEKDWDAAEQALQDALEESGTEYVINEGDGAFYGPKIDFHIRDAIGRTWQTATIQLDFQMPQRFKCVYLGEDSAKHTCVMIHRALLGSVERFMAVLIENHAGKMPTWLSPEQVRVLPIADRHHERAKEVAFELEEAGIRVHVDARAETVGKKVREAQLEYVPYILVIGDNEVEAKTVTVRTRDGVVHGAESVADFVARISQVIEDKK